MRFRVGTYVRRTNRVVRMSQYVSVVGKGTKRTWRAALDDEVVNSGHPPYEHVPGPREKIWDDKTPGTQAVSVFRMEQQQTETVEFLSSAEVLWRLSPDTLTELLTATNFVAAQYEPEIPPISLPEFMAFLALTAVAGVRKMTGTRGMFESGFNFLRGNDAFRQVLT